MPSIHLRGLTCAHLPTEPVLTDVTLDVHPSPDHPLGDWVGVVGANGAGKSTLLDVLSGVLAPTSGAVTLSPHTTVHRVPQEAAAPTDAVLGFGWRWDGEAQQLRRRLQLDPDDLHADLGVGWDALSPGQRTRWLVGAALAAEADLLLLDEPTNHLDAVGRTLLLDALRLHRGLGLVVSHDRTLLDALTQRTLRVHDGTVTLHAGCYGEASARWRADEVRRREADDAARRAVARERRQLADLRRARHGAEAGAARDRRLAGPRDSDARELGRKVAAAKAEAAIARRVTAQHSRLDRAAARTDDDLGRDHRGTVAFRPGDDAPTGDRVLASVVGDVAHAGGEALLHEVDVTLRAGQRVHLRGDNGAGKSTLLHALRAALPAAIDVGWLPQRVEDHVLATVTALAPDQRGRVLGTAARLGVLPDRVLTAGRTTPGERRKLGLALLLAGSADLLVLDEPTNHLDLPAVEALQAALTDWPGGLVLVTHDDALAAAATTVTWTVADGRVTPG